MKGLEWQEGCNLIVTWPTRALLTSQVPWDAESVTVAVCSSCWRQLPSVFCCPQATHYTCLPPNAATPCSSSPCVLCWEEVLCVKAGNELPQPLEHGTLPGVVSCVQTPCPSFSVFPEHLWWMPWLEAVLWASQGALHAESFSIQEPPCFM